MADESIVDIASKLMGIKGAVETGRQREAAAQRSEMKFMLDQQRAQQKAELDNMKYVTNKYTDFYFKAKGNTALQENILATMQGMKQSMPPAFRQQFDIFTKTGPFSDVAEKGRKFTELYGSGPRALTKEESELPMLKGEHAFAVLDYNQKKEHFLTGHSPGKKRRFVSLDDGAVLGRTEDGFFYQTTTDALAIQAIAKDNGVNPGKLLADDGLIFGTSRKGMIGGRPVTTTPYKDVMGNMKNGEDVVYGEQVGKGEKPEWQTPALKSLLINFMGESEGASEGAKWARNIKELIKDSGIVPMTREERLVPPTKKKRRAELRELNNIITARMNLIPEFRNLNFKVYDPEFDKHDWFSAWGASDKATLTTIPGTPEKVLTADGHVMKVYNYQGDAYSGDGEYMGSFEDITQTFNNTNKIDLLR